MNPQEINRIEGIVSTKVLDEFSDAVKALYREICFGVDEGMYDTLEATAFIKNRMNCAVQTAAIEGKPAEPEVTPIVECAVKYVRRYVGDGTNSRPVAERFAKVLYALDEAGVTAMQTELNRLGVE
jgi:hypothetical protein